MSGRAMARRFITSRLAAYSARGERRNLRRAGTRPNSASTRTRVPGGNAAGPSETSTPLSTTRLQPSAPRTRLSSVIRATLAIEGNASPRKPRVVTWSISSSGSLEVAWRSSASAISGGDMPQPSSVTSIRSVPPPASLTAIRAAPASIAFSTSSFSALAGRSTTSPAAIRLTRCSGRRRIDMVVALAQAAASRDPNRMATRPDSSVRPGKVPD